MLILQFLVLSEDPVLTSSAPPFQKLCYRELDCMYKHLRQIFLGETGKILSFQGSLLFNYSKDMKDHF